MSILVPFLAQKVELYPSELSALRDALGRYLQLLLFSDAQQLSTEQAYALKPLGKAHNRLQQCLRKKLPAGKTRKVCFEFDELLALRRLNAAIQSAGGYELPLIAATGKIHQKSLSLEGKIQFQ